jgi:ubiquitin carboxyl-terminal hydrolase 36/42
MQFSAYPFVSNYLERFSLTQGYKSKYAYRLYAVIAHVGTSLESGHYTTFINCPGSNWYKLNDAQVTVASVEEVLKAPGYLMFYSRLCDDNENKLYT